MPPPILRSCLGNLGPAQDVGIEGTTSDLPRTFSSCFTRFSERKKEREELSRELALALFKLSFQTGLPFAHPRVPPHLRTSPLPGSPVFLLKDWMLDSLVGRQGEGP